MGGCAKQFGNLVGIHKHRGNTQRALLRPARWFLAALFFVGAPAQAWISPTTNVASVFTDLGTCDVDIKSLAGYEFAYVKLMGNTRSAGGSVWKFGAKDTVRPAPTPSEIEASCGLTSVSISSSIGADAASYAAQELMELVLRATDTADGKTYDYVYRLSGGAGTVPVVTRTKTEVVSGPSAQDTQDGNADFSQRQANNILGTTPSMTGFLNGTGIASRNFNLDARNGSFNLRFNGSLLTTGSSKNFAGKTDVWASLLATRSNASTTSGDFVIGYLGAHRFIRENLLIGGMIQFDYGTETESTAGSTGTGRGFMLGPYVAGEIGTSGLRFEGQARWGRSFNTISPIGTYTDGYSTTRWMTRARLEGSVNRGDWTITPNINLTYFNEVQAAYTDSLANSIAAQTITLGEVKLGPDFSRTSILNNGNPLQTRFGIAAVSNFAVSNTAGSQAFPLGEGQIRTRIDFGISTTTSAGWGLSVDGFYDGLGVTDYQSYGGTIKAELVF